MKAPEKVGRYTAYFRMQTGHSVRFGHKVWCDILVGEPSKAQIMSSIVMQEDNLAKSVELDPSSPRDIPAEEQKFVDDFFKEDLSVSVSQLNATPKQVYFNKMNAITNNEMLQALSSLFEFGFVDFDTNHELLVKYQMNIEMAVNHLCSEQQ